MCWIWMCVLCNVLDLNAWYAMSCALCDVLHPSSWIHAAHPAGIGAGTWSMTHVYITSSMTHVHVSSLNHARSAPWRRRFGWRHHPDDSDDALTHDAVFCSVLQFVAVCCSVLQWFGWRNYSDHSDDVPYLIPMMILKIRMILYNTLQHSASHCNTLQHFASHCNTLQHTAAQCSTMHHESIQNDPNDVQHSDDHCRYPI